MSVYRTSGRNLYVHTCVSGTHKTEQKSSILQMKWINYYREIKDD